MKSLRLKLNLQLFADDGGDVGAGVESASAAGMQSDSGSIESPSQSEPTGVNGAQSASDAAAGQNNFEKAFAKRLAAKQAEWEKERGEYQTQLKDVGAYRKATEYLQRSAGINDLTALQEQIELLELQERAQRENVPVEVLKRIDELEKGNKELGTWKEQREKQEQYQTFQQNLQSFAAEKGTDAKELHKFMYENRISNFDVAHRAMRAEELEAELTASKSGTIKEYLASKKAPKAEGASGAAAMKSVDTAKMSWDEIDKVAASRLRAAKNPT